MINRDAEFWDRIAFDPLVSPRVFMGLGEMSLAPLVENEKNLPFSSENGGVILVSLDHFGLVREMHALYQPQGWGREVAKAVPYFMKEAFNTTSVIFTHEQEGEWRTSPPKSHGWKVVSDFCYVEMPKRLRLWMLTKEAFYASPVGRKLCQQ